MKYALVTGANGGMGRATVNALLKEGFYVFALDKIIQRREMNLYSINCDIASVDDVKKAYKIVSSITNHLDVIIHFAGIYCLDSLVEMEEANFEKALHINVFGAFYVNKNFMPLLRKNSRIIITTSELAVRSMLPFTGLYAVTKKALDSYAYSLRMELQLLDIHVSVIRPGAVRTSILNDSTNALDVFINKTKYYDISAKNFKNIVDSVESKYVSPKALAKKVLQVINKKKPKFAYNINHNKLLKLLDVLPVSLRFFVIKKILLG